MGSTGPANILFSCICVVALLSMVVVGSVAQEETLKPGVPEETSTTVSEETPKAVAAEETPKAAILEETSTAAPKETTKSAAIQEETSTAVPKETRKSVTVEETPKATIPEETSTVVPKKTPKSAAAEETPKATVPEETSTAVPKETPKSAVPEKNLGSAAPKAKFISVGALECAGNITRKRSARKLIVDQGNGVCPMRFDHTRGISAIASSCKDRPFPSAVRCCTALKTYACPYSELINDSGNGCANDMFYVIMVRGKLRPGIFSQLCVEGPLGLQC